MESMTLDTPTQNRKATAPAMLVSVKEVASMIGKSERTVWSWSQLGLMPGPLRIGRTMVWRVREVESWIEAGCPRRRVK